MNNIQNLPPLDEIFPKPPFHYKNDNLIPPNLDLIHQYINPEYVSFGKTMKIFDDKSQNECPLTLEKTPITDFKAELKKINKSIISKVLELFEYSSKGSENLQDILSDIMKLVEKFYEITTNIKNTVQAQEDMVEVLKKEIKTIEENKEKLLNGIRLIHRKLKE